MKRMSFQLSVKSLLVAFFMIGGFAVVSETNAQSGGYVNGNAFAATVTLVDAQEAILRLANEVMVNYQLLGNYVPGTASYNYVYRRTAYFKEIVNQIGSGATVTDSVVGAMIIFALDGDPVLIAPKQDQAAYFNEAVALLKQ